MHYLQKLKDDYNSTRVDPKPSCKEGDRSSMSAVVNVTLMG